MKKQNFFKGSVILMLSAVAAKLLGALFKIPLTNILGGVGMSYFSCAYSVFMPVYALTVTGLSSAVARLTAQSIALGMYENVRRIRRTAHLLFSAAGLAGGGAVALLAGKFSEYSVGDDQAALAVMMIAPSVLFGCVTAVERGYYEGMRDMYPTAASQVFEGIVKAGAGLCLSGYVSAHGREIIVYFPGMTDVRALAAAAGILGVSLSSLGAVIFFGIMGIFRRSPKLKGESHIQSHREIAAELVRTALPVGISAVVTNLTALIDMWTMIGCISKFGTNIKPPAGISPEDMPQFIYGSFAGIALTVFNLVPSVTNMLGKGALPYITSAWEKKDMELLKHSTSQALFGSAFIAVPSAVGIGVLSKEILLFLFSRQTDEALLCAEPLRLLMPGMVLLCISSTVFSMLQAVGRADVPLKIMLIGTAVKLAGNIAMIPFMGAEGAALSTSVSYGVIAVLSLWIYFKYTGTAPDITPLLAVVYSGAMCGGAVWLVSDILQRPGASGFISLLIPVCIGGAVYLLSVWLSARKELSANS